MGFPRRQNACGLYLITPPRLDLPVFIDALALALAGGGVACVQLRLKTGDVRAAAEALMPIVRDAGATFLINDDVRLAHEISADGAHIGQSDMGAEEARALLGSDAILGISCHASVDLARKAEADGAGGTGSADYVAFGAFHPTKTKRGAPRAHSDILNAWRRESALPSVAIGGITPENAEPLVSAGADYLAVSSGVWDNPQGAAAAVQDFNQLFKTCKTR